MQNAPIVNSFVLNGEEDNIHEKIKSYANGIENTWLQTTNTFEYFRDANGFVIGNRSSNNSMAINSISSYFFRGNVGEVIVFEDILSEDQIKAISDYFLIKYGGKNTCELPQIRLDMT